MDNMDNMDKIRLTPAPLNTTQLFQQSGYLMIVENAFKIFCLFAFSPFRHSAYYRNKNHLGSAGFSPYHLENSLKYGNRANCLSILYISFFIFIQKFAVSPLLCYSRKQIGNYSLSFLLIEMTPFNTDDEKKQANQKRHKLPKWPYMKKKKKNH